MTKTRTLLAAAVIIMGGSFGICRAQVNTTVSQLEEDIQYHEDVVDERKDSIELLDAQIALLKLRLDSLNKETKDVKAQISALEKEKKAMFKDIKEANKARQLTFATRDNMVFDQQVQDVLLKPFDKQAVEEAMKHFDDMETKDVLKKKELVENYGKYTKELRDLLADYRGAFEKTRWAKIEIDSDLSKKFTKDLKKCSYYKVYERGLKSPKNATIPYLDKVIDEIVLLQRQGFNSKLQYEKVENKLYGN